MPGEHETEILRQELEECRRRVSDLTSELANLKDKFQFLNEVLDSLEDVIQVTDTQGGLKYTNAAFHRQSGFTPEETEGMNVSTINASEEAQRNIEKIIELTQQPAGSSVTVNFRSQDKQGKFHILEAHAVNRLDEPICGLVWSLRDITNRVDDSEDLFGWHANISAVFNGIQDAVIVHDFSGKIININQRTRDMFELDWPSLIVETADFYYSSYGNQKLDLHSIWCELPQEQNKLFEWTIRRPSDGKCFDAEVWLRSIQLGTDNFILVTVRDITERKRMEQKLKDSISEKEALLRELHHRVKNNFAVMASLLRLQSRQITDSRIVDILKQTEFRIKCMGLVHDKLHQSESLDSIRVNEYLQSLVQNLWDVYGCLEKGIKLKTRIDPISLGAETAIPLGFITSELVSNSLKHAFNGDGGEIFVQLRQFPDTRRISLEVRDNGKGLPVNIDLENLPSLGLKLVTTFARQIGATFKWETEQGARFIVDFDSEEGK